MVASRASATVRASPISPTMAEVLEVRVSPNFFHRIAEALEAMVIFDNSHKSFYITTCKTVHVINKYYSYHEQFLMLVNLQPRVSGLAILALEV